MVGAGWILQMMVSFSRPSHASYSNLTHSPLTTHFKYNSRRREVTGCRGGGSLPAEGSVAVR
jgi:hypothetical protein